MPIRALPFLLILASLFQEINAIAQANTSLSNLNNPTNINVSLTPNSNAVLNVGSSTKGWRRIYLSTNGIIYLGTDRTLHANYALKNFSAGPWAGHTSITGSRNSLIGTETGGIISSGSDNTFVGYRAGYSNTSGHSNTFVGSQAAYSNSFAQNSCAFGFRALYSIQNINYNSAFGAYASYSNTSGVNSSFGHEALRQTTTGTWNSAFGKGAMYSNVNGDMNVAVGHSAGAASQGDYNVFVGASSGSSINSHRNTMLGYHAGGFASNVTNATAVGYYTITTASNQVRLGDLNVTSIGGYQAWSNISDGRFKKDIKENVPGLDFINKLRPVTYVLDYTLLDNHLKKVSGNGDKSDWPKLTSSTSAVISGFVAQEVEKAANAVKFEFDGVDKPKNDNDLYALRYSEFVVPLVKAVQELARKIDEKDSVINEMQKIINELAEKSGLNQPFRTKGSVAQNYPNPARTSTVITYELPANAPSSHILITDAAGRELKRIKITNGQRGNITVNTSTLAAGIYNYSLVIEGKITSSRKMTIVR